VNKKLAATLAIVPLFLTGCMNGNSTDEQQEEIDALHNNITELEETITSQETVIDRQRSVITTLEETVNENNEVIDDMSSEFSYLSDLTDSENTAYERYLEEKDTSLLSELSPDKIVLIYFHSVAISDWETIYDITYDNGSLPEYSEFQEMTRESSFQFDAMEASLDYRDYDFIRVRDEENLDEEDALVEIQVSFGINGFSTIYGLKKDQDIWKLDVLDMM